MTLETIFGNEQTLIQLGRFFITFVAGAFLTRAIVMPLTRKFLSNRKDEKTLHSIVNI